MAEVLRRQRAMFQVNPDLVLWPGERVLCLLAGEGGDAAARFDLPDAAVRVLLAFGRPRGLTEVFGQAAGEAAGVIEECVAHNLLLTTRTRRPRPSGAVSRLWGGFRAGDHSVVDRMQRGRTRIAREHRLGGRRLVVLDEALPPAWLAPMHRWFFQLAYRRIDVDTHRTSRYRHWISPFNPVGHYASAVPLFRAVEMLARDVLDARAYTLRRLHAYATTHGDVLTPHRDLERAAGITGVLFGNAEWDDSWMGEMLFYDDRGDPVIAVAPRPGRLVVFDAGIVHRGGAPSRECHETRYSLVFKFS